MLFSTTNCVSTDFKISSWFTANVDSYFGHRHHEDEGWAADLYWEHNAPITMAEELRDGECWIIYDDQATGIGQLEPIGLDIGLSPLLLPYSHFL